METHHSGVPTTNQHKRKRKRSAGGNRGTREEDDGGNVELLGSTPPEQVNDDALPASAFPFRKDLFFASDHNNMQIPMRITHAHSSF